MLCRLLQIVRRSDHRGRCTARIQRDLGLRFWDFVMRWSDPHGQIARNHASHIYFEDESRTPFVLCLKHEASQVIKETTKCLFLMERSLDEEHPLGVARCGIYQFRPTACRAFPTKMNETGELAVILRCSGTGSV